MKDSQEKDYSVLGNDTFPNLYDALIYERKFKSEYLERQIYERTFKSEPSTGADPGFLLGGGAPLTD